MVTGFAVAEKSNPPPSSYMVVMNSDLLYQLALSSVPNIGYVHAKILVQHFSSAEAIFNAPVRVLERIEGIGTVRAGCIRDYRDFSEAEQEMKFMEKYGVKPLFLSDADYPKRLLQCYDPPTLLFYRGNADLNAERMVAVIGTRSSSAYGRRVTEELVKELSDQLREQGKGSSLSVVSGLAFGIDAVAHKTALKNGVPTVGVLAHGMGTIYPKEHAGLAKEMMKEGGILTEFYSREQPDRHHFPTRNRIVAGCCDAVVVVETGIKGGSMITAELANGYNRDVFAVPGRITDIRSEGCNRLIQQNKAISLGSVAQLMDCMGWIKVKKKAAPQPELFPALSEPESKLVEILRSKETVHLEEFTQNCGLTPGMLAGALLNLELQNVIESMPGKRYKLR